MRLKTSVLVVFDAESESAADDARSNWPGCCCVGSWIVTSYDGALVMIATHRRRRLFWTELDAPRWPWENATQLVRELGEVCERRAWHRLRMTSTVSVICESTGELGVSYLCLPFFEAEEITFWMLLSRGEDGCRWEKDGRREERRLKNL